MLEQEKELRRASGPPVPLPVVGIAILLVAAVAGLLWWRSQFSTGQGPVLTEEAKQYLSQRAIDLRALPTLELVEAYNKSDQRKAAVIHVTC